MIAAARWRKRQRGGSAMLLILVQIQAGPPAFAGSASYGSASPPSGPRTQSGPALLVSPEGPACRAEARRAKAGRRQTPLISPKIAVDGGLLGVSRVRNLV